MTDDAKKKEGEEYSRILKETLHLNGSPIAWAIVREPPERMQQWQKEGTGMCYMVERARGGEVFYCTAEGQFCHGPAFIGMVPLAGPEYQIENYLSAAKKLFCSGP